MPYEGGHLKAPISVADVGTAIGSNSLDVATLCSNANNSIKRWAKYKPVRYDKVGDITLDERKSVMYGLSPNYIASATNAASNIINNIQTTIPSTGLWNYYAPRPGTDWCRLTDFLNNADPTNVGYWIGAKAPISGFRDFQIFQSQFGSEDVLYSLFNMAWGSSGAGVGDLSGIEIFLPELKSDIADGTWRLAFLIYFPATSMSAPQKGASTYRVIIASAPMAIRTTFDASHSPGMMFPRPTGTGLLKSWMNKAFNAGISELTAIPVLAHNISRTSGSDESDFWTTQSNSQFMSMPEGDRITLKLSARIANFSMSYSAITITYLNNAGSSTGPVYTPAPNATIQFAKPSASGATRCRIRLTVTITGNMATGDSIPLSRIYLGLSSIGFVNAAVSSMTKNGSAVSSIAPAGDSISGTYVITATDAQITSGAVSTSSIMGAIENMPRGNNYAADTFTIKPMIELDGAHFDATNSFIYRNRG